MKLTFLSMLLGAYPSVSSATSESLRGPRRLSMDSVAHLDRFLSETCPDAIVVQSGTANIDGSATEWTEDFFVANMYEAGDDTKENASKAYMMYDCGTNTLCVHVRAQSGYTLDTTQNWVKDYGTSSKELVPNAFEFIDLISETETVGWEACYPRPAECREQIEVHSNFGAISGDGGRGRTTSTGKRGNYIKIDLSCGCETATDCTSSDACVVPDCSSNRCVNTAIEGCDCDSVEDCPVPADDCLEAYCDQADPNKSTWKCMEKPKDSPDCLPPSEQCVVGSESACFDLFVNETAECANAACTDTNECSFTANPAKLDLPCGAQHTPDDDCDLGYSCDGKNCVHKYQNAGEQCTMYSIPDGHHGECVKGLCQVNDGITSCVAVSANEDQRCNAAGSPRGVCDSGDVCKDGVCTDMQYMAADTECRGATGCCDAPETCTGASYDCPADKFYGPGMDDAAPKTCRDSCFAGDPAEVCPGGSEPDCPPNQILDDELCIMAGQHHDAGTAHFTATPGDTTSLYNFCLTVTLENGWTISDGNEQVKIYISNTEQPGSNPGQYNYKLGDGTITELSTNVFQVCVAYDVGSFCGEDAFNLYIAIHIDVTNGSQGETAWALPCDGNVDTGFSTDGFWNRKGTAMRGWGRYHVWSPLCPGECGDNCDGNDGPGDGPGDDPSEDPTCSWECSDSTSGTCLPGEVAICAVPP